MVPTKENKNWKPVKSKDADSGNYELVKSKDYTMKHDPVHAIPKGKSEKFTTIYAKSKKHIPGSGHYKPETSVDRTSRPYMKKRF